MLATIILDTFQQSEARQIADALDVLCSPKDNYGFSSACVYSFWRVPTREILYIGLARDITKRFKQHTSLIHCGPDCCKASELDGYFKTNKRLGFSIIVQSRLSHPLSTKDKALIDNLLRDDPLASPCDDVYGAEENIRTAEGKLIQLFNLSVNRLPQWNKIGGAIHARNLGTSLGDEMLRSIVGSEPSVLNATATLREISSDSTFSEHEFFLHGVRLLMLGGASYESAIRTQLGYVPSVQERVDQIECEGYLKRRLELPGLDATGEGD